MNLKLSHSSGFVRSQVRITGSKSESNRLLILQALFPEIGIQNLSNSDDTRVLQKALQSTDGILDIHHAGTAMRFLTSYFACREGSEVVLTGSQRMQERPIQILVNALRELGANIEYVKEEGFPPLKIVGRELVRDEVSIEANVSSQYISSLMLIAPKLPNGLKINLKGRLTSVPYIEMSLALMKECGLQGSFKNSCITIEAAKELKPVELVVESDWSSASYFYSIAALSEEADIELQSYKRDSHQGDRVVAEIYEQLGVETNFLSNSIHIKKLKVAPPEKLSWDLSNSPDLAQTISVSCLGLGIACRLTGLHTLQIKETNRLLALKTEMEKLGATVDITSDTLELQPLDNIEKNISIATYNDHRMALAFAPLALKVPVIIADAEVVSKSFPGYWEDLQKLNFSVEKLQAE